MARSTTTTLPIGATSSLMAALPQNIAAAKERAPAYRDRLAKVRPEDIADRRALVDLPLTHKSELIELQRQHPGSGVQPPRQFLLQLARGPRGRASRFL